MPLQKEKKQVKLNIITSYKHSLTSTSGPKARLLTMNQQRLRGKSKCTAVRLLLLLKIQIKKTERRLSRPNGKQMNQDVLRRPSSPDKNSS